MRLPAQPFYIDCTTQRQWFTAFPSIATQECQSFTDIVKYYTADSILSPLWSGGQCKINSKSVFCHFPLSHASQVRGNLHALSFKHVTNKPDWGEALFREQPPSSLKNCLSSSSDRHGQLTHLAFWNFGFPWNLTDALNKSPLILIYCSHDLLSQTCVLWGPDSTGNAGAGTLYAAEHVKAADLTAPCFWVIILWK